MCAMKAALPCEVEARGADGADGAGRVGARLGGWGHAKVTALCEGRPVEPPHHVGLRGADERV